MNKPGNHLKPLKMAFLTPYFSQNRGNATTAKRIVTGLGEAGVETFVYAYNEEPFSAEIHQQLDNCSLIHVLHFFRFARWVEKHHYQITKPYVLTSGGTDINENLFQRGGARVMQSLLENAAGISVFTNDGREKLLHVFPNLASKVHVIAQSVWLPSPTQNDLNLPKGNPKILLPAGLREVKDVLFLIDELDRLQHTFPDLQFIIAGLNLDVHVHNQVKRYVNKRPWMQFIENVTLSNMSHLYEWADYVLNTSISEGQSSAILEAMTFDSLVFARDNAGNKSIIKDGVNGMIFNTGAEFLSKITQVHDNPFLKIKIQEQAKEYVNRHHHFKTEIGLYMELYRETMRQ